MEIANCKHNCILEFVKYTILSELFAFILQDRKT